MTEDTPAAADAPPSEPRARGPGADARVRRLLGRRALVLIGMMGAGKSTVGRRLATRLHLHFRDADHEIEAAAGMSIADIFAIYGEPQFRDGERRVIARLLQEAPLVLATGGGAYMDPATRAAIAQAGVSVWLRADLPVLMKRVRKRGTRPLLQNPDPEGVMSRLMETRHPIYAQADLTVESHEGSHDRVVDAVVAALDGWLADHETTP